MRYFLDGNRLRNIDEVVQLTGLRFFRMMTELEAKEDWLQTELLKEIENGRSALVDMVLHKNLSAQRATQYIAE